MPAGLALPRLGNRLALVPAQRLNGQPGVPQIGLVHGDRRLGQRLGDAMVGPSTLAAPAAASSRVSLSGSATAPRAAQISR